MATPGDVNINAIEKVIPENIGIVVGILLLCALETKHRIFELFLVGRPFSSHHI